MAQARKAQVIITANASVAERVMQELEGAATRAANRMKSLTDTAAPLKERMKQLAAEGKKDSDEFRRLNEQVKQLDKEYKVAEKDFQAFNSRMRENVKDTKRVEQVMKDLANTATRDLRRALQAAKRELDKMSANDPKRQKLLSDMKRLQAQIDANTGSLKKQQSAWGSLGTTMKNLFAYAGIFAGFNKLKSMVEGVFSANLKLSDSLADIRKVSGLAMSDINKLYNNISKIDSRNTIETLNKLAYTGAKLGIGQNYGVEGLTGFVKAAEQVQMALGEDMGEKALPELAKMTEVMGLIDKYGVEQSMQKAASAIFQLGATSTATGTNIVEFSKRLYGLANVSRVSTDDLLALGSAADAMGLMPEVAATAFNKLFTSVQRQHNLIEQTLGMQKGRIKELYDEGKTMDAIVEIFDKMNQKGNLNLLGSVFKDLGSDGARLVNVMATMADRVDILKKHLITSRDAFREGEAVIGEYMIQNQTAQAMMERSANLWAKAFTNPEGVDMVKQMAQAWYDVSKSMTQSEAQMKSLHNSISIIAFSIETLIKLLPFLIRGLMMFGVAAAIRGVVMGVGGLVTAIRTATTAQIALNTAMKSNWFLAIASAIGAALTLLYDYAKAAEEAAERETKRQAELKAAFENSREAVDSVVKPLEVYKKALDDASLSEKQRMELVKQFKDTYQDYLDYLGLEITSAVDLAKAYAQVVRVMKQKKAYEERESFRQQKNGDNRMTRIENQAQVEAQLQSMGITGIDKKWLEENQHLGTKGVYDKIIRQQYGMGAWEVKGTGRGRWAMRDSKGKIKEIGSEALYDIIDDYISAYRTERDTNKQIDAMFNSEYKDIDLEHFNIDEFNDRVQRARWKRKGSLDNEKPDKAALAAAKKAAQDAKQAMRKDLKDAQEASTGILSKLEEYYRLQETAIQEARADGQLTEDQAKEMVRSLNIMKNESLATARRAITTGETEDWDKLKTTILPAVMSDTSEVSRTLLETIQQVAVDKLHSDLAKFNGDEKTVFGLDSRAFFDQMRAKAAGNEREAARLRAKIQNEVEKALLQYQFVEKANQQMRKDLEAMGITTETYEQFAKRMQAGIMEKQPTITTSGREITDEQAYREMGNKFVEMGVINFRYNIDNEEEARQWVKQFATDAKGDLEGWAQAFPQLSEWIDLIKRKEQGETLGEAEQKALEEAMPAIRNLFDEMMRHADRLNKAMKDAFQHEKEQQESRFRIAGYKDQEEQTDKVYSNQAKQQETGAGQNFVQMLGLGSIANDPEILQIQNRIRWRAMEVEDAQRQLDALKAQQDERIAKLRETAASESEIHAMEQQHAQDRAGLEQLLMDRQTALTEQTTALTTQTMQELQKRSQAILKLSKPFTDAANSIGKKLGDMIRGAEEDSITWEEIWKNMALAVGEAMIEMGAQYLQNLIMQQSINRASEAEEAAHVATEVPMGIAAGSAKTIGQLGWWGIPLVAVISALLMGLLQAALSTNRNNNSANAAKPKVKLASGMLTYDKGNVQQTVGSQWRGKNGEYITDERRTVVGDDGRVYRAREQRSLPEGVSMVTEPIATRVNGQQALVGERGPEIVIGRKTTRAIQMNRPDLLRDLAMIDRGITTRKVRTFDEGNIQDLASAFTPAPADGQTQKDSQQDGQLTSDDARALTAAIGVFAQTVAAMQKNGIPAKIQKYGTGGLIDEVQSGLKFVSKYK